MVNTQHPELVDVCLKVGAVKGRRKDIYKLFVGANQKEAEEIDLEAFLNHMIVDV